jgi:hypothetical protein
MRRGLATTIAKAFARDVATLSRCGVSFPSWKASDVYQHCGMHAPGPVKQQPGGGGHRRVVAQDVFQRHAPARDRRRCARAASRKLSPSPRTGTTPGGRHRGRGGGGGQPPGTVRNERREASSRPAPARLPQPQQGPTPAPLRIPRRAPAYAQPSTTRTSRCSGSEGCSLLAAERPVVRLSVPLGCLLIHECRGLGERRDWAASSPSSPPCSMHHCVHRGSSRRAALAYSAR